MAVAADRKEYPISMRLPEADVAMIDRAAGLRGRSRTDFVREAAVRAAEQGVIELEEAADWLASIEERVRRGAFFCTATGVAVRAVKP